MEVDEAPEKKLLDQLESALEPTKEQPDPEPKVENGSAESSEKMEADDTEKTNEHATNASKDSVDEVPSNDKPEAGPVKDESTAQKKEQLVPLQEKKPSKEKRQSKGRKRDLQSPSKVNRMSAETKPGPDLSVLTDTPSPSKRQRKPKKFEDEEEKEKLVKPVVDKAPKPKPQVPADDPELEAKYPGMMLKINYYPLLKAEECCFGIVSQSSFLLYMSFN